MSTTTTTSHRPDGQPDSSVPAAWRAGFRPGPGRRFDSLAEALTALAAEADYRHELAQADIEELSDVRQLTTRAARRPRAVTAGEWQAVCRAITAELRSVTPLVALPEETSSSLSAERGPQIRARVLRRATAEAAESYGYGTPAGRWWVAVEGVRR
jgi:hypothetical protein